jgi:hypothetical protein
MDTFRQKLRRAFRMYRAAHILLNSPSPEELAGLDDSLDNIDRMPGPELRRKGRAFQQAFVEIRERYGVRGKTEDFEELLSGYAAASKPIMYVAKFDLERLFSRYENRLPDFGKLPPHGRIGIEVGGRRSDPNEIKTFILEASLFEDMAALWNTAASSTEAAAPGDSAVYEKKHAAALRRAVAKASFNLLEGYLNGLALDIQLTQRITKEEKTKLQEWDDTKQRPVRLSLRDKVLQYVKIAVHAEHPPIQESNSEPLTLILAMEAAVRHALIHPTPRYSPDEATYRENVYLNLTLEQVKAICDAVVLLIRQISSVVGPRFGDVDTWLFERDAANRYPERAFN